MSSPKKFKRSACRFAFFGNNPIIARDVSDLPQPDSPTIQSVSPRDTSNEIPRTGWSKPADTGISILKLSTSRTTSFFSLNVLSPMSHHAGRPQINLSLKLIETSLFRARPITKVKRTYILFLHLALDPS